MPLRAAPPKTPSQRPAPTPLRVLYTDEGLGVAEIGRICVAVWRDEVIWPRFEQQRRGLGEVVQRHPRGAAFICVVEPTSRPPTAELRHASVQMIQEHAAVLRCVALVIEGDGFRAALNRGAVSSLALLRPDRVAPAAAFARVSAALDWAAQYVPIDAPEEALAHVEDLRAALPVSTRSPIAR